MMSQTIYIARHGQTQWNEAERLQGQLDSPLTPQGSAQMRALAFKLKDKSVGFIATSVLGRTVASGACCAQILNVPCKAFDGLQERHFGEWQGQYLSLICRLQQYDHVFSHRANNAPFKGETAFACAERFHHALQQLLNASPTDDILLISHGEVIAHFLCMYFGKCYQSISLANGCYVQLRVNSETKQYIDYKIAK